MKKVRIKPTSAESSLKTVSRVFRDEIQKMVEFYFAQGLESHEVAEKLGIIDFKEMDRRYNQVLRQYLVASDQLNIETAKIEILRILKRSLIRRDSIAAEVERRERRLVAGMDEDFPNKEIANLREEDKFIYKIMTDMDKSIRPKGKDMSEKSIELIKKAEDVESTRTFFRDMVVEYSPTKSEDILSPELEEDILASMEEEEW